MTNNIDVDIAPRPWSGRTDGLGPEHLRWHQAVTPYRPGAGPGTVLIGFASDEGVRRNKGRQGAAAGPDALRKALSSMALEKETALSDAGTVAVTGDRLEEGQDALGRAVTTALDSGRLAVVLGGATRSRTAPTWVSPDPRCGSSIRVWASSTSTPTSICAVTRSRVPGRRSARSPRPRRLRVPATGTTSSASASPATPTCCSTLRTASGSGTSWTITAVSPIAPGSTSSSPISWATSTSST